MKTRVIYTHVSNRDIGKIKSPLDMRGGIIPIQDDMHIGGYTRVIRNWVVSPFLDISFRFFDISFNSSESKLNDSNLTLDIKLANGFLSKPIELTPINAASTFNVPLPHIESNTISPSSYQLKV